MNIGDAVRYKGRTAVVEARKRGRYTVPPKRFPDSRAGDAYTLVRIRIGNAQTWVNVRDCEVAA